jgi:hypothetical protein
VEESMTPFAQSIILVVKDTTNGIGTENTKKVP